MALDKIELLEFVRDHPSLRAKVLAALDLDPQGVDPLDVPLHEFPFRRARLTVFADPEVPESKTQHVNLAVAQAPDAAVGRDAEGDLFLIRRGDWVLRSPDGDYGLLRALGKDGDGSE